jgi:hypothetical protein
MMLCGKTPTTIAQIREMGKTKATVDMPRIAVEPDWKQQTSPRIELHQAIKN